MHDFLIGSYLLSQRLNGTAYGIFLEEILSELLDNVPVGVRNTMWLHHDGASHHFSLNVCNYRNATFSVLSIT